MYEVKRKRFERVTKVGELQSPEVSAADELDDFQTVTVAKRRLLPFVARDDLQIQLDSDAIGLTAQLRNESRQSKAIRNVSGFAVDLESHEMSLTRGTTKETNANESLIDIPSAPFDSVLTCCGFFSMLCSNQQHRIGLPIKQTQIDVEVRDAIMSSNTLGMNGRLCMSKATREQRTFSRYSGVGHTEAHRKLLFTYYCIFIEPLQNKARALRILNLRCCTQEIIDTPLPNHLEHVAMLLLQEFVNHVLRKIGMTQPVRIRGTMFTDARPTNEDHRLE